MSTLIKPPENDSSVSLMENMLELTHLSAIDPDMFTNTRQLWHPPGARGIYGGAVIAQCLSAAQKTVPKDFNIHSMHCYFVLAGNADIPVCYHVERIRDGRSFCTRTVQARQKAKVIFTVTLSFMKERDKTEKIVTHAVPFPNVPQIEQDGEDYSRGPFESRHIPTFRGAPDTPDQSKTRMWIRTKGSISDQGGHEAHLNAVAYMSDSYFIGTVARVHRLWRENPDAKPEVKKGSDGERKADYRSDNERGNNQNTGDRTSNAEKRPEIGIMVSLDHTIYFHNPRDFRADEWLLSEMQTPWAGDDRGLVFQHIWTKDGLLVATCVQEGMLRLKQDKQRPSKL